jgi:hypothetical protein
MRTANDKKSHWQFPLQGLTKLPYGTSIDCPAGDPDDIGGKGFCLFNNIINGSQAAIDKKYVMPPVADHSTKVCNPDRWKIRFLTMIIWVTYEQNFHLKDLVGSFTASIFG